MNIKNCVKSIRNSLKLTQEEMADLLGVSNTSISLYESGSRIPSDKVKVKYAEISGKSVGEIFYGE